jgi:hypothetical protein
VVNALPLPALDGGYLALLALEAVRRKKLDQVRAPPRSDRCAHTFVHRLPVMMTCCHNAVRDVLWVQGGRWDNGQRDVINSNTSGCCCRVIHAAHCSNRSLLQHPESPIAGWCTEARGSIGPFNVLML